MCCLVERAEGAQKVPQLLVYVVGHADLSVAKLGLAQMVEERRERVSESLHVIKGEATLSRVAKVHGHRALYQLQRGECLALATVSAV